MSRARIRVDVANHLSFLCPGCNERHSVNHLWEFNGNFLSPTFSPSILATSGHHTPGHDGKSCWCTFNVGDPDETRFKCFRCHSFVTDGKIQFLDDCSHAMAGQTVDLPEIPVEL